MIKLKVLILEDEPVMCKKVYPLIFDELTLQLPKYYFDVEGFLSYREAYENTKETSKLNGFYYLAILDIRLGGDESNDGLKIGRLIREMSPMVKIMFITSISDRYRLTKAFKEINPEGFLIKSELNYHELKSAIMNVILGKKYYTSTIKKFIKEKDSLYLDELDLEILKELSMGTKTVNLPQIFSMSLSGIENRKRKIADVLGLEKTETEGLIKIAYRKKII